MRPSFSIPSASSSFTWLFLLVIWILSCQPIDEPPIVLVDPAVAEEAIIGSTFNFPSLPLDYRIYTEPPHASQPNTSVTEFHAIRLGRVMFYDNNLSLDGTISCASCHQQAYAFGDNQALSVGVNGNMSRRNTLAMGTVLNGLPYHTLPNGLHHRPQFMWDEWTKSPLEAMKRHLSDPTIMGIDPDSLVSRLSLVPYYPILYKRAFPQQPEEMRTDFLVGGLGGFTGTFSTQNSHFDGAFKAMKEGEWMEDYLGFSPSENMGKNLFFTHCASCHGNYLGYDIAVEFNQLEDFSACNGLDIHYEDQGIGDLPDKSSHAGMFRVPSLRNIEVSAPYMHDGRFASLREVLEFYNSEIQPHPNLHPLLQDSVGAPVRLQLTDTELEAIEDFLRTLTDQKFLTSPKWSNPFR
ncbi:MAG: cytochrome c peroxidase [Bacteroidota bacterium]